MADEASARAKRAAELGAAVLRRADFLGDLSINRMSDLVGQVIKAVGMALTGAEHMVSRAGGDLGHPAAAEAFLTIGALSVAFQGFPDGDKRLALFEAGKEIGEYYTELVSQRLLEAAAAEAAAATTPEEKN
jgi:hypothetical protein